MFTLGCIFLDNCLFVHLRVERVSKYRKWDFSNSKCYWNYTCCSIHCLVKSGSIVFLGHCHRIAATVAGKVTWITKAIVDLQEQDKDFDERNQKLFKDN